VVSEPGPAAWSWRAAVLAAVPAAVIATIFLLRGLVNGPTLDGAVFALIGDVVAHGGMPYRDVWDHKPPGVYLANGLMGVILPDIGAWPRAWLLSWLSTVGAILGLSVLLTRSGQRWPGIVAATLVALPLFAAHLFVLGGGQTESVGLFLAVLGVGLAVSGERARSMVAAGVALGAAVLVSVQFIPAIVAAVVLAALARQGRVRGVAALVLGSLVVPGFALAWIVANGSLPDMLEQVVAYNRIYFTFNQQYRVSSLVSASGAIVILLPAIVAALARILALRRGGATRLEVGAVVWLIVGVALVVVQGLYFDHYLTALGPPLVILAAPSLGIALAATRSTRRPATATVLLIVVLAAPALVGVAVTEGKSAPATTVSAVADRIRELTAPDDPIFVWGNDAAVYLAADRPLGSRFVYMFPLTTAYGTPAVMARIVEAWETHPPRMIVDATRNPGRVGGYPLEASTDPSQPDAGLDPLRSYVRDHYRILTSVNGWDLYVEEAPNS
jgi:hypothetical protein